jgi:inhibitor of cysteine peptidase
MHALMTRSALAAALCVFMLPALAEAPGGGSAGAVKAFAEKDNGQAVVLEVETPFDVRLKGNATTGYAWKVASIKGKSIAQQGEVNYKAEETGRVGSGGIYTAHFKAIEPGQSTLRLEYVRPWEKGIAPVREFILDVTVTGKASKS